MKALVLNNPFAWLIFNGKEFETRLRKTNVTGEILICSAKKPYANHVVFNVSGPEQMARIGHLTTTRPHGLGLDGYALGVVTLVGSRPMVKEDEQKSFVQFEEGYSRWVWEFQNIRKIEPFAWKFGKQGWLNVPQSELIKINYL